MDYRFYHLRKIVMKTAKKALNSIVVPLLAFTMIVNLASCGTSSSPWTAASNRLLRPHSSLIVKLRA